MILDEFLKCKGILGILGIDMCVLICKLWLVGIMKGSIIDVVDDLLYVFD